jgi:hypothetical protein
VEESIRLAAVILQAVAIIVTAGFAIAGLHSWRRQTLGKRRVEVAEETLVLAHKVRNAISFVRLPVQGPDEGRGRPMRKDQPGFEKVRDSYYVPIERLRSYDDDFAKLERQRLLCETYFAPGAAEPLRALTDIRLRILSAARDLLALPTDRPLTDEQISNVGRWEAIIWDFGDQADQIAASTDEAVKRIEEFCRPYLRI